TAASLSQPSKPKKISYGRGGGNYIKVSEKKSASGAADKVSTSKKIIEVEPPRLKATYSGRGGAGNGWVHVVEDGVFDRVMQYELGKAKAYRAEKDAKRRTRTDSNAKSTKASSVGSDDCEYHPTNLTTEVVREPLFNMQSSPAQSRLSIRQSWASKSLVDFSSTHASAQPDAASVVHQQQRKSLRETLLAPLKTTFTRQPKSTTSPTTIRDDSSSFFAGSSTELGHPRGGEGMNDDAAFLASPISPVSPIILEEDDYYDGYPPASPGGTEDTHSAVTPSTAEMMGELLPPGHNSAISAYESSRVSTTNAFAFDSIAASSLVLASFLVASLVAFYANYEYCLPASLTPINVASPSTAPPPLPSVTLNPSSNNGDIDVSIAKREVAPVKTQVMLRTVSSSTTSSSSSSNDRLAVPGVNGLPPPIPGRAPNRRMYNASIAARSAGHLPLPVISSFNFRDAREASMYDDSEVDRVDPFLARLGRQIQAKEKEGGGDGTNKSFESLLPWIDVPDSSALSSTSDISIPSINDSRPELVSG
ncbi:1146_t:CDS:2, partial [Acaulospora colombiana]